MEDAGLQDHENRDRTGHAHRHERQMTPVAALKIRLRVCSAYCLEVCGAFTPLLLGSHSMVSWRQDEQQYLHNIQIITTQSTPHLVQAGGSLGILSTHVEANESLNESISEAKLRICHKPAMILRSRQHQQGWTVPGQCLQALTNSQSSDHAAKP